MSKYELVKLYPNPSDVKIINTIVETPQGEHHKYDLDPGTGLLHLDRPIHSSLVFPANYGYLPNTRSGDGDPLDAIILSGYPLLAGSVVECRVVGSMVMKDESGVDSKIICVVEKDPRMRFLRSLSDIPRPTLDELKHFFVHIKDLEEGKWAEVAGFEDETAALELIAKSYRQGKMSL